MSEHWKRTWSYLYFLLLILTNTINLQGCCWQILSLPLLRIEGCKLRYDHWYGHWTVTAKYLAHFWWKKLDTSDEWLKFPVSSLECRVQYLMKIYQGSKWHTSNIDTGPRSLLSIAKLAFPQTTTYQPTRNYRWWSIQVNFTSYNIKYTWIYSFLCGTSGQERKHAPVQHSTIYNAKF